MCCHDTQLIIGPVCCCFFFFNDTATTEIYTLSLHDALPIYISEEDSLARDCFTSATIPTISIQGTLGSGLGMAPTCMCCPIGDWLEKYVRAKLELTTTTAGAPSRSRSSIHRPVMSGTPSVFK